MIEAALVLAIFVVTILFVIDISRYFFVYSVLSYGANSAADLASKLDVEISTDRKTCTSLPRPTPDPCLSYRARVQMILNQAIKIANLVSSEDGGSVVRRKFDHYYTERDSSDPAHDQVVFGGDDDSPIVGSAAFLRPGEKVRAQATDKYSEQEFEHPTRSFTTGWPTLSESWNSVLSNDPLEIQIEANYKPITPLIGDIPLHIRAFAYRKAAQFSRPSHIYTPKPTGSSSSSSSTSSSSASSSSSTSTGTYVPTPTPVDCGCCASGSSQCADPSTCLVPPCSGLGGIG
jgi:hypothetical protein